MTKTDPGQIVVAANFTIESIRGPVMSLLAKLLPRFDLLFAPYNQIFQQLLDPGSLFHRNTHGANVIFLRLEDLIDSRNGGVESIRNELGRIKANAAELLNGLRSAERFKVPLFLFICPASIAIQTDPALAAEFQAMEQTFGEINSSVSNVFVFGTSHVASRYRVAEIYNPEANLLGHIPYSASFFAALGIETVRKIDGYFRKPVKVLVLDCDNTLWDGVVGEDGVDGICLSENRLFIQKLAVEQSQAGTVVCLNSKNNEDDVWEVFEKRDDMLLKKRHIVSSRINWHPKSENLRSIAEELQLALDSFVFIDDDAAVCDEVRRNCPEVMTIQLPAGSEDLRGFFEHLWVFDKLTITEEDKGRTASYQTQVLRREYQAKASDITEFLASLELVCEIAELDARDVARTSQLTLRTNQFNSTTPRLNEAEVREYISSRGKTLWTIKVRDRFGDYGLVGVVIFEERAAALHVEAFLLSCRILGRGVEHQIVNRLGRKASETGREFVSFDFVRTEKNLPVLDFLTQIGKPGESTDESQTVFTVPTTGAMECVPRPTPQPERRANQGSPQKRARISAEASDRSTFYIELARSLSTGGTSALSGAATGLSRAELKSEFRSAQTPTEEKLTQIWEQVLHASAIGASDDFFEIGGDSLIAVSLFVEIEKQLGRSLPITTLLNSPTIEKLARLIDFEPETVAWKYLVPLQPDGTKPPLLCMHAAGGNVLFYRDLASALGDDQPVYGLQARGIADKSETAHDRVEDMAAEYIDEIRQLQPKGPYRLCGSSFGGLVAFECAKQLLESGELVSVLGLFDTYAPEYLNNHLAKKTPLSVIQQSIERIRSAAGRFRELKSRTEQKEFIFDRIQRIKDRQKRKILWKKNEIALQYNKATGRELPSDLSRNHRAIRKAEADYHPTPYDGTLILIRASDQPRATKFDPFLGWKGYAREIITEEVNGSHGAITVHPFAAGLAAKFNKYLEDDNGQSKPGSTVAIGEGNGRPVEAANYAGAV